MTATRPGRDWPALHDGEILVWWLDLEHCYSPHEYECLASAELERAARFVFDRDRRRFIAGRVALRRALLHYTGIAEAELSLAEGTHGKPYLSAASDVTFNLTHSGGTGLLAMSRGADIGIDLERVILPANPLAVAASVFTPDECRDLQTMPDAQLAAGFFACWTRKEACLKALGAGMSLDPRKIHVGCGRFSGPDETRVLANGQSIEIGAVVDSDKWIASLAVVGAMKPHRVVNCLPGV